jgi:hypothetical protein
MAGHFVARKLHQSGVLGELAIGIPVGALFYQLSAPTVTILRHSDQVVAVTQKVLQQNMGRHAAIRLIPSCSQWAIFCRRKVPPANAQARRLCHLLIANRYHPSGGQIIRGRKSPDPSGCCQPPISPIFAGGQNPSLLCQLQGGLAFV